MTLDEIGVKYGTDKSSIAHNFLVYYEKLLADRDIKTIIEVGIWEGASLRTWAEFFPKAKVIGLDIDKKRLFFEQSISCYCADQADPLNTIGPVVLFNNPDLFVDDGSHYWSHQINTFNTIFPLLETGAIYIVEDLHTSMPGYEAWKDSNINPLEYFSKMDGFTIVRNNDNSITGWIIKC